MATKTTTTTAAPEKNSAPAENQQPTPSDPKFEPGHEPGDSLDATLGIPVAGFPEDAKEAVTAAIKEAATEPGPAGVQPHGIANLTSPSPAATDEELRHYPDEVAKRQAEAFTQTAVGQAIIDDEEKD